MQYISLLCYYRMELVIYCTQRVVVSYARQSHFFEEKKNYVTNLHISLTVIFDNYYILVKCVKGF